MFLLALRIQNAPIGHTLMGKVNIPLDKQSTITKIGISPLFSPKTFSIEVADTKKECYCPL